MDQNSLKFYIGKRLFQLAFKKNGKDHLSGLVLDVGSGTTPFKDETGKCRLVTLEREARFRPAVIGSATSLPFGGKVFDGVICTEVLEHLSEPEACFAEIGRILKPGGIVYITTPMTWYLHYEPFDYFRFTPHGLKHLAKKNGFEVLTLEPIGGLAAILGMIVLEKIYNLFYKFLFFVPKRFRLSVLAPFVLPPSWLFYHFTSLIDRFSRRWIFSVCLVGRKENG